MQDYIKGEGLVLYVWDDTIYRPIACLTSNSISRSKSIIEAITKCSPGVVERGGGTTSYEIPFEGVYIDTTSAGAEITKASHDYLMEVFDNPNAQSWKMDSGLADNPAYYGEAIFESLELSAPAGDEFASFSGSFSGSGAIVTTDPKA